jgi:hypothetical protein
MLPEKKPAVPTWQEAGAQQNNKEKNLCPHQESNPNSLTVQLIVWSLTELQSKDPPQIHNHPFPVYCNWTVISLFCDTVSTVEQSISYDGIIVLGSNEEVVAYFTVLLEGLKSW